MPELPEVETVKRELEHHLLNKTIEDVYIYETRFRRPIPDDTSQRLKGLEIEKIDRRAKNIIFNFKDSKHALHLHLGMSGRVKVTLPSKSSDIIPRLKHEHVIIRMASGERIGFVDPRRFGVFYCVDNVDHVFKNLGPEPLCDAFTSEVLFDVLKNKKTPIKNALLDQRIIAGLGNIYVCEALHQASIHPSRLAHTLDQNDCTRLSAAIKQILLKAIDLGGSTLRDHQRTNGESGQFQNIFKVYGSHDRSCQTCSKGKIIRIVQSNRSTFFCPLCQI